MNKLNNYLRKRECEIFLILEMSPKEYTVTTFHKLRIEIKKLKALMMLINKSTSGFRYKKTFKPFKIIFQQAGKVRELQIEEAMMKKYNLAPTLKEYRSRLKTSLLREQSCFFRLINEKSKSKLKRKYSLLQTFISGVNKKKALKYLLMKQIKIQKLLKATTLNNGQTHELRKRLKYYDYNRRSLRVDDEFKLFSHQEELNLILGEWHDGQVTLQHLSHAMDDIKIPSAGLEELQKTKEKIYSQNEILLNKMNALRR
ncbi:MAG: CHAD domain-containing protein [Saprospiraceae bacterium]